MASLQEQFGDIDIYLFDQLLRGRIAPGMRILDAGCGSGRNLVFLLQAGCEVFAADSDSTSVAAVRQRFGIAEVAVHGRDPAGLRLDVGRRPDVVRRVTHPHADSVPRPETRPHHFSSACVPRS